MQNIQLAIVLQEKAAVLAATIQMDTLGTDCGTDAAKDLEHDLTRIERWLLSYASFYENEGYQLNKFLSDIVQHGCASGIISSLIYTHECISFYDQFEADIWELVSDHLNCSGITFGQFIDSFNDIEADCVESFKNMLAWFAVEAVALKLWDANDAR